MDYEAKYKEMVQRARELHETGNALTKMQMEIVCPELSESEDERIRKWLYDLVAGNLKTTVSPFPRKDVLAYLEKQKDCIFVLKSHLNPEGELGESRMKIIDENEKIRKALIALVEWAECFSASGITKDESKAMLSYLEKQKENPKTANSIPLNCASDAKSELTDDYPIGFPFDSEVMNVMCDAEQGDRNWRNKADVKFCSDKLLAIVHDGLEKQKEQKAKVEYVYPKFRVGDEIVEINPNGYCPPVVVKYIGDGSYSCESKDRKSFLSLPIKSEDKYKLIKPQPAEWSDEDKLYIDECIKLIKSDLSTASFEPNYRRRLEKGLDLIQQFYFQSMQEWSEEDERLKQYAIHGLEKYIKEHPDPEFGNATPCEKVAVRWLKSLRSHWKPSKEQMKVLEVAITYFSPFSKERFIIESLHDDLEKL